MSGPGEQGGSFWCTTRPEAVVLNSVAASSSASARPLVRRATVRTLRTPRLRSRRDEKRDVSQQEAEQIAEEDLNPDQARFTPVPYGYAAAMDFGVPDQPPVSAFDVGDIRRHAVALVTARLDARRRQPEAQPLFVRLLEDTVCTSLREPNTLALLLYELTTLNVALLEDLALGAWPAARRGPAVGRPAVRT
jgi:hypothetical protein